jgi:hypothetical protein
MTDSGQSDGWDADQFLEGMRTFVNSVQDDPEHALNDDAAFSALPLEDRQEAVRELISVLPPLAEVTDPTDVFALLPEIIKYVAPWLWTAEVWQSSPDTDRLVNEFAGDGPLLRSPVSGTSDEGNDVSASGAWSIRAVDTRAAEQWGTVCARLPDALLPIYEELISGVFEASRVMQQALRGSLAAVTIDNERLDLRQARFATSIRHGKRTNRDPAGFVLVQGGRARFHLQGEARVLYAANLRDHQVWITEAALFKRDPRSQQSVFWPPEEGRAVVPKSLS